MCMLPCQVPLLSADSRHTIVSARTVKGKRLAHSRLRPLQGSIGWGGFRNDVRLRGTEVDLETCDRPTLGSLLATAFYFLLKFIVSCPSRYIPSSPSKYLLAHSWFVATEILVRPHSGCTSHSLLMTLSISAGKSIPVRTANMPRTLRCRTCRTIRNLAATHTRWLEHFGIRAARRPRQIYLCAICDHVQIGSWYRNGYRASIFATFRERARLRTIQISGTFESSSSAPFLSALAAFDLRFRSLFATTS
jgi:hypothetical protein